MWVAKNSNECRVVKNSNECVRHSTELKITAWPLAVFHAKLPNGQPFPKVVGPFGQSIITRQCHFVAGVGSLLHTDTVTKMSGSIG